MESRRDVLKLAGAAVALSSLGIETVSRAALVPLSDPGLWINRESTRWLWVLARMIDTNSDTKAFVDSTAALHVNVLVVTTGGLVAFYPSKVPYHFVSPYMAEGRDYFGEIATHAKAAGVRICSRVDYSRVVGQAYQDHPEWFFIRSDGQPVKDETGRYQPCINGGFYREHALKITDEILSRYAISALFMNNFVNDPRSWGDQGLCHCANCQLKFKERAGRTIPEKPDDEYRKFINDCVSEASALHRQVVKSKQPDCIYLNDTEPTDGAHTESRMTPSIWPYGAGASVNHMRNSAPNKAAINIVVSYSANAQRLATMPPNQVQHELYQAMAHGSSPVLAITGTTRQEDRSSVTGAAPVFAWAAANQDLYVGQKSAARVLVLGRAPERIIFGSDDSFRGIVRILAEAHLPFAISENTDGLKADAKAYDLVISLSSADADLNAYVMGGGRAIFVGAPPSFALGQPVKRWRDVKSSYFRIHDRKLFPSVSYTDLVTLSGDYLEYPPETNPALTFIPPSLSEMAETAQSDMKESTMPGLLLRDHGSGRIAYIPWDMPGIYHRQMFPAHAALFTDLIDYLLLGPRQLRTNTHPQVEIVLMDQPAHQRRLLHLINSTGQAQCGYAPTLPVREIAIDIAGVFRSATARSSGHKLPIKNEGGRTKFVIPELGAYEVVALS